MKLSNSPCAFTLLETVVVIAITTMVGGALMSMIQSFYRTNDYILQESAAVQNARQGLTTTSETLREASYGADGSYPIATAATSSITFFADMDNTGTVEEIQYLLQRGTLYQVVTTPSGNPPVYGSTISTSTIATYLVNGNMLPVFTYTDTSGNLMSTTSAINISQVQAVTVTLKIDVDPNRSPAPYTLTSMIALRNLRVQ